MRWYKASRGVFGRELVASGWCKTATGGVKHVYRRGDAVGEVDSAMGGGSALAFEALANWAGYGFAMRGAAWSCVMI